MSTAIYKNDDDDEDDLFGGGDDDDGEEQEEGGGSNVSVTLQDRRQHDEIPGGSKSTKDSVSATPVKTETTDEDVGDKQQARPPESSESIKVAVKSETTTSTTSGAVDKPATSNTTSIPRKRPSSATSTTVSSPSSPGKGAKKPKYDTPSKSSSSKKIKTKPNVRPDGSGANASTTAGPSNDRSGKFGLPKEVSVPASVTRDLIHGRLLETIRTLPPNLINDALQEFDDAVHNKGQSIRNHGAYLFGVVKRYINVQERAQKAKKEGQTGSSVLPMGADLTPAVHARLAKLVSDGYCTGDEMNDKVKAKIKMLSEKDALSAIEELASVSRTQIRNFGSYFMGILNRYMRGEPSKFKNNNNSNSNTNGSKNGGSNRNNSNSNSNSSNNGGGGGGDQYGHNQVCALLLVVVVPLGETTVKCHQSSILISQISLISHVSSFVSFLI
mmetsp:Transcript_56470/g.137043  ORF Transcript_56470/g.137043 Transcript_56470/m.137043 type:complete len:442 (+) Transcript_56470:75-1400(+)